MLIYICCKIFLRVIILAGALEFIRKYGDKTFDELEFCDADNAALCGMFYMPIEKAAPNGIDDEPILFSEACEKMYGLNGGRHVAVGLVLWKGISIQMMEMARSKRYSEVKIAYARSEFNEEPAVQFAAATLILPDGTLVLPFRGTDDTFAGWIEDLDIYTKKGIPSHRLAVDYINTVAAAYDGDMIICGHSKGGNVALYGAMHCDEKYKDRIKTVYNNDGPGFHNFDYINSPEYRELLPKYRHFIPHSAFVGVMLAHDDDYTVVRSSRMLGPMQHDIATWQIKGTEFVTQPELTRLGKITDLSLMNLFLRISDDQSKVLEKALLTVVQGTGQTCLKDFAKNALSSVNGAAKAWKALDDATKVGFRTAFGNTGRYIKTAVKVVKNDAIPTIEKKVADLASTVMA